MTDQRWAQMWVDLPSEAVQPVSTAAFAAGCVGAQEDLPEGVQPVIRQPWDTGPPPPPPAQVRLRLWFGEAEAGRGLEAVRAAAQRVPGAGEVRLVWDHAEDWAQAWRAGFERLVISDSLVVAPPWSAEDGDLVIEPGMAFGTGEHPTTRACLRGVDRHAHAGHTLLDVGCGTGVLALAGARAGMTVAGVDIDADAVVASNENAARNGLAGAFSTTPLQQVEGTYDLVVANIFAEVLVMLAPHLVRVCGRRLLLAGILADRADRVVAALGALEVVHREQEGDWVYLELAPTRED